MKKRWKRRRLSGAGLAEEATGCWEEQEPRRGGSLLVVWWGAVAVEWRWGGLSEAVRATGGGVKERSAGTGQDDRRDDRRECDQDTPWETCLDGLEAGHDEEERGADRGGGDQRRDTPGY